MRETRGQNVLVIIYTLNEGDACMVSVAIANKSSARKRQGKILLKGPRCGWKRILLTPS
jgi:hypothetical protein